ncbi:MAG TPA: cytochrome c peroxidase [Fimbriimonas sp.]|nr:cytochrome c peroxidase [Fimbriimonas sp.]
MKARTPARWFLITTSLSVGAVGVFSNSNDPRTALGTPGPVAFPANNPFNKEKADLGKKLFHEAKMSKSDMTPCSWCHFPGLGFTDGRQFSPGASGEHQTRNTPTLINIGYADVLFWDGRMNSLEEQSLFPIKHPKEMGMKLEDVPKKLKQAGYEAEFEKVFGTKDITLERISLALSTYERTITENNTPFDRYTRGETNAMLPEAIEGLKIFQTKGQCLDCHAGPHFTNAMIPGENPYRNTGLKTPEGMKPDDGRMEVEKSNLAMKAAFKIPTLRGVGKTAPYMHNGSLKTLEDVVEFYNRGGDEGKLPKLNLTEAEKHALVIFMRNGLTDWYVKH